MRLATRLVALAACAAASTALPATWVSPTTNITFRLIQPGSYVQGFSVTPLPGNLTLDMDCRVYGDFDEQPYSVVKIPYAFYVGETEVTNAQYERYDPGHASWRGHLGWSKADSEAAVFLSWHDASGMAGWLAGQERRGYRLPTEGEWEYFTRAGTRTYYNTGDTYPYGKNQVQSWYPGRPTFPGSVVVNLTVGEFPPNAWGLHDTHGNVEEFTSSSYAYYGDLAPSTPLVDTFKVTRGGSHSTQPYFLRSANRAGILPEDHSWFVGMRLVMDVPAELGGRPQTQPPVHGAAPQQLPLAASQRTNVAATTAVQAAPAAAPTAPFFRRPLQYVVVSNPYHTPFTEHNHDPALVVCPNGDVLATWFSTITERGRESSLVYARLPAGSEQWPPAAPLFSTPDRLDNAPDMHMWRNGSLLHVHGASAAATWGNNVVVARRSEDCGVTWGKPWVALPGHGLRHQPVNTLIETLNGSLLMPSDNNTYGSGGTAVHHSVDGGATWSNAGWHPRGDILGIHGTLVQLRNGSLLAFGRGNDIDGNMAQSRSDDWGSSWTYSASPFPGIVGGQRGIVLRLAEGPILFCSYATNGTQALTPQCGAGRGSRTVYGYYCAVSADEGNSWPWRRLVSDDGPGTVLQALDGRLWTMNATHGEPLGYSTARQGADGTVHVISSRQHYRFNLAWAQTRPPCADA